MDVTPKQATRVMVPWGGTSLLTRFAVRKSPELHQVTKNFWVHRKKFRKMIAGELPEETLREEVAWRNQFSRGAFLKEIISAQGLETASVLSETRTIDEYAPVKNPS
jgi:hypothetical protein